MHRVLIVVDVQNDFMPGGALPVPYGDEVVPVINELLERDWDQVFYTRDYHPAETPHFEKWPPHCVAFTPGADLHPRLFFKWGTTIFKGQGSKDGYSGFEGKNVYERPLAELIPSNSEVFIVGLATDYCVRATALDALGCAGAVTVVLSACRAVSRETEVAALDEMSRAGVNIVWRLP